MIQIGELTSTGCFICLILKSRSGEISEENIGPARRLATDFLRDIANCQVYGVCTFIMEKCEEGFVGRYDKGDDGGTGLDFFKLLLQIEVM